MRNIASFLFLAASIVVVSFTMFGPAQAQSLQGEFFGQEQFYDRFTDSRGRRFLVDPETGEIVGRANRNARFTRRDKRRAQREFRRQLRKGRLNRELGELFGLRDSDEVRPRRRQRLFDRGNERQRARRPEAAPLAPARPLTQEEELARLPDVQEPVRETPQLSGMSKPRFNKKQMVSLQVFLDREGFSPGAIDGRWGSNVAKAAASWKEAKGKSDDLGNAGVLSRLVAASGGDVLTTYTISQKDVAGPFVRSVPTDYAEKAKLQKLAYTSVAEMLAERFHMSQRYLQELNKGKNLNRAGTRITVVAPGAKVKRSVHYIVADKSRKQIRAYDRNGSLVTAYPATIGSAQTPSPTGSHSVARIAVNPEYTYNPKINFTQGSNKKILRIPPGPNGPVGSVWIALSKPTYGIHGTPNPDTIGKTNSHGCIRLTNWDALELAKIVSKGVTVEFVE